MTLQGFAQKCTTLACVAALVCSCTLWPTTALADNSSELEKLRQQADNMAQQIEEATSTYQQAEAEVEALRQQIEENEQRTAEIEEKLPEQRKKTAASIRALYIFQQSSPGLLGLILSAEDFNDFISTISYIDSIHERNTSEIEALASLNKELYDTKGQLALQYDAAEQVQNEALAALEEARSAKRELQRRADQIAAEEQRAREEAIAAAQQAIQAAQQAPAQEAQPAQAQDNGAAPAQEPQEEAPAEATFTTSSGNTAKVEVPTESTSPSTEPITTNTTSQETSSWAARIDAYLAGSPLAGYGATFAAAAAKYGVDPRFSPAISCVESSKGAICFRPHNAWGWGSSSWDNWESAIYDHVAGLASLYGGTLTIEGAKMYCPPTYQEWYSSVLAEMNSI